MRGKNRIPTERVQLSLSENLASVLEEMIDLGIFGKTKPEVVASIIANWIWGNEDRLARQEFY